MLFRSENQNENLIIKYLNNEYGDLKEWRTDRFPSSIFFVKDKKIYMEYVKASKNLWIDNYTIWSNLKDIFGLKNEEIQPIISKWVEETYKLRGVTKGKVLTAGERRWMNLNLTNYSIDVKKLDRVLINYLNREYGDLKEYRTDEHPNSVYLVKDNKVYMELDTKYNGLYVDYTTIWEDLINIIGGKYDEIKRIIKKWVEDTYKLKDVTTVDTTKKNASRWKTLIN